MTSQQRLLIRELVKKYSADSGTEPLIAIVAGTTGLLAACQAILQSIDDADSNDAEWLQQECLRYDVAFHSFLQDVSRLVTIFRPGQSVDAHYTTLGVSAGAGLEEIKRAYRKRSLQYHPDTAASQHNNEPEKFIEINKAYHALLSNYNNREKENLVPSEHRWRRNKERRVSPEQRKKVFMWSLGLLAVLMVVSTVGSMHLRKRAMLAGLQESRGAFVPPARQASFKQGDTIVQKKDAGSPGKAEEHVIPAQNDSATVHQDQPIEPPRQLATESQKISAGNSLMPVRSEQLVAVNETPKTAPQNQPILKSNDLEINSLESTASPDEKKSRVERPVERPKETGELLPENLKEEFAIAQTQLPPAEQKVAASLTKETLVSDKKSNPERVASRPSNSAGKRVVAQNQISVTVATQNEGEEQPVPADPPSTIEVPAPSADLNRASQTVSDQSDLESRIDLFLDKYIKAYDQRNLILFSRFFVADAEENGKSFTSMLPVYLDLFAKTSNLSLNVTKTSWQMTDAGLSLEGKFSVDIHYRDARIIIGTGPIHFVLTNESGEFLVKTLEYDFYAEK